MARISRRYPTLAALLKDGNLLATAISEEGDDLPNLQDPRVRLQEKLSRLHELLVRVDALQAEKQGLVQEMHGLQEDAARLMTFLDLGVKSRYGNKSEALARFGLKPFRRRKASPQQPETSSAPPQASGTSAD